MVHPQGRGKPSDMLDVVIAKPCCSFVAVLVYGDPGSRRVAAKGKPDVSVEATLRSLLSILSVEVAKRLA